MHSDAEMPGTILMIVIHGYNSHNCDLKSKQMSGRKKWEFKDQRTKIVGNKIIAKKS